MTNFVVSKNTIDTLEPVAVHQGRDFKDAEDFIHIAISQPENTEHLYVINHGDKMLAAYRMIDGQIICKRFATVNAA